MLQMAPRAGRSRSRFVAGLVAVCCVAVACCVAADAFLPAPCSSGHTGRRQALSALAACAPLLSAAGPRAAVAEESPRLAVYRGKATGLRASAEWYLFTLGDLVRKGSTLKPTDDCGVGLCPEAKALARVRNALTAGGTARGGVQALAQVDLNLVSPMTQMANMDVFDPDASDDSRVQVTEFAGAVLQLADGIQRNPLDGNAALLLYVESLKKLNKFFSSANEALGVKADEDRYLPQLPLGQAELEASEYWKLERQAYDAAQDPVAQFQDRNAFGSKELREDLKRFPGATLLLR
mmetsp:Transcript_10183/g.26214  ORF Transcript_10183/g.26214 Transcript_10183/m.26214 type:complete len:294 (-) Transcript_10183:43-924(-)